jgi:hypothetical protein
MSIRLLFLAALVVPLPLSAQDSTRIADTPPFHGGQWAAQFTGGPSFSSLGFIKFRSPTRALVLDVRVSGSHQEELVTDSTGTHLLGVESRATVDVRLGLRRYHASGAKIVSHLSFGIVGGFTHLVASGGAFRNDGNGWDAGVFADLGASYLVTPHFGIGVTAAATISYASFLATTSAPAPKRRTWSFTGTAPSPAFVATLFF